jgi:hypothetical protein
MLENGQTLAAMAEVLARSPSTGSSAAWSPRSSFRVSPHLVVGRELQHARRFAVFQLHLRPAGPRAEVFTVDLGAPPPVSSPKYAKALPAK